MNRLNKCEFGMDLLDFVMDMSGFLYLLFSSFCFQGKYKKSSASFLVHWMKKFEVFGLLDGGGEFFTPSPQAGDFPFPYISFRNISMTCSLVASLGLPG